MLRRAIIFLFFVICLSASAQSNPPLPTPAATPEPVLIPEPSAKALQYYRSGNITFAVRTLYELLIPAVILFSGLSARLRNLAQRIGKNWFATTAIYVLFFVLIYSLLYLPMEYYGGFVRPHAFDLSNQTFAKWFSDAFKSMLLLLFFGTTLAWIPYLLLKRSPRRWWLYAGLAAIPCSFAVQILRPVLVDPMFNDYSRIPDSSLELKITKLAEQSGIHGSRVFQVNKSVDTKMVNAYVTGFLGTKRIVLWDTIIAKLDEDELLFVMAHEMGHYVLGHVVKGVFAVSILILIAFYAVHRAAPPLIRRFHKRWQIHGLDDIASLPLFLLLLNLVSLILTPIGFAYSRHLEREADRFALELTHLNRPAATGFIKLHHENLSFPWPGPFYKIWRATHPSVGQRIHFFNTYHPWLDATKPGEPGLFFETDEKPSHK